MGPAPTASKKAKKPSRMVIGVRGSDEWKRWVDEYAYFRRMTLNDLIDKVLEEGARRDGFKTPPMR